MKRLFVVGCSFTHFFWPSWGDYLVHHFNTTGRFGINFGKCGAGNQYMFIRLMEHAAEYKFNEDDLVIVEWSSYHREDRYTNAQWITPGNIFTQGIYSDTFINMWADPKYYVYRDMAIIKATQLAMKQMGVQYYDLSMMPLRQLSSDGDKEPDQFINQQIDLHELTTSFVPIMEFCGLLNHSPSAANKRKKTYYGNEPSTNARPEWHPMPEEHWKYVNEVIAPKLNFTFTQSTIDFHNYWVDKINNIKEPIGLAETGWNN